MPPPDQIFSWTNLLTLAAFPALGYYMRSLIRYREESDKERHETLRTAIGKLEHCVGNIKRDVDDKRDVADCEARSKEKWERINKHTHDKDGRVVIV